MTISPTPTGRTRLRRTAGSGSSRWPRHLAALPSRNHDMYFALVTGHFQLPQFSRTILDPAHPVVGAGAVSVWMLDHPDIYQAATLGVTVEHLGATMWTGDPVTGQYVPVGGSEWGTTCRPQAPRSARGCFSPSRSDW
jgi:hypothetical protein